MYEVYHSERERSLTVTLTRMRPLLVTCTLLVSSKFRPSSLLDVNLSCPAHPARDDDGTTNGSSPNHKRAPVGNGSNHPISIYHISLNPITLVRSIPSTHLPSPYTPRLRPPSYVSPTLFLRFSYERPRPSSFSFSFSSSPLTVHPPTTSRYHIPYYNTSQT